MKKTKKGFTLTELIIVIVIIGILAGVLIPSLTGYINKAKISNDTTDVRNMNMVLSNYSIEKNIDLKKLEATEVRYIVNLENKNYTFVPSYKKGVFWYDQTKGKIVYSENGVSGEISAAGEAVNPSSVEEIKEGYLYLNTSGNLANALLKIRNLSNKAVYDQLVSNPVYENIDLSNILNTYNPSTTLFVSASGGFTESSATNYSYTNMPSINSGTWKWGNGNEIKLSQITDSTYYRVDSDGTALNNSLYITAIWCNNQWVFKSVDGGKLVVSEFGDIYKPIDTNGSVKKIIFSDNLSIIPSLNINGIKIADGVNIVLPISTKIVMSDAFTSINSQTKIETKSSKQKVQFVDGSLSYSLQNANQNVKFVDLAVLSKDITENATLLSFEVSKSSETYVYRLAYNQDNSEYEVLKNDVKINTHKIDINTSINIEIGEIINSNNFKLKIVTSQLFKQFSEIDTLNVNYEEKSNKINATIRAFDNSGMIINIILVYGNK